MTLPKQYGIEQGDVLNGLAKAKKSKDSRI